MSINKGKYFENTASNYLKQKGYIILEKNYRCIYGEIDIISELDNYIIFIEVKFRKNKKFGLPTEAVNLKKQNKIKLTSLNYISENNILGKSFRYDVIGILGNEIEHIENAFY